MRRRDRQSFALGALLGSVVQGRLDLSSARISCARDVCRRTFATDHVAGECSSSQIAYHASSASASAAVACVVRGGAVDDDYEQDRRRYDYGQPNGRDVRSRRPPRDGYRNSGDGPNDRGGAKDRRLMGDSRGEPSKREDRRGNFGRNEGFDRDPREQRRRNERPARGPGDAFDQRNQQTPGNGMPPPPPPPPQSKYDINPAETERLPINYSFARADVAAEERRKDEVLSPDNKEAADGTPYLDSDERYHLDRQRRRRDEDEDERLRASPRRDAVTTYMSAKRGAIKVRFGCVIVGAALGGFIGKSLLNDPKVAAVAFSLLLLVTGFLRNDYGELSRALGLAFVMTLNRTSSVRREYPTLPHIKAMLRQKPRKPFPPVDEGDSPWRYEPRYRDDPEFKMTYSLLAMGFVGSFCGGNVPVIPAWMGSIAGALVFAAMTMGSNARGDLGRSMGMRMVGLGKVALEINSELSVLRKGATVGGLIFDKIMVMDRKHRIKDKLVSIFNWGYERASSTFQKVQTDMQDDQR